MLAIVLPCTYWGRVILQEPGMLYCVISTRGSVGSLHGRLAARFAG